MKTTGRSRAGSARKAQSGGSNVTPFVLGAVAGGLVGAALAFLYTPVAGEEVRKGVGEKFDDFTDSINEILYHAKTSAQKMLDEGRGTAEDILSDMEDGIDDIFHRDEHPKSDTASAGASSAGSSNGSSHSGGDGSTPSQAGFGNQGGSRL